MRWLQRLQFESFAPHDALTWAFTLLLVAVAVAVVVGALAYAIRALLSEPLSLILKSWHTFLEELKGEKDKAGSINAFSVVGFFLLLLLALLFEVGPPLLTQLVGRDPGPQQTPVMSLACLVGLLVIFFGSIVMISRDERERELRRRVARVLIVERQE